MKTKLKTKPDEEEGGHGGASLAVSTNAAPVELSVAEARGLRDIARKGGGVVFVIMPSTVSLSVLKSLQLRAFVDLLEGVTMTECKLTHAGLQALTNAAKVLAGAPGRNA